MSATLQEIGSQFTEARLGMQLSVRDVSNRLKIRKKYIQAIESGDFQGLPGRIYIGGYIKTYAKFLNLDGDKMLQALKERGENFEVKKEFALPEMSPDESRPSRGIIWISLAVLALCYGIWYLFIYHPSTPQDPQESSPATAETPPVAQENSTGRLVLLANEETLITLYDEAGNMAATKSLQAGDTYFVPTEGLYLAPEAAGHVEVYVDGAPVPHNIPELTSSKGIKLESDALLAAQKSAEQH